MLTESASTEVKAKKHRKVLKTGPTECIFRFKGRSIHGRTVNGTIKAPNRELALKGLFEERIIVQHLEEIDEDHYLKPPKFFIRLPWMSPLRDVAIFTRQLASMYRAGVPLFRAVGILHDQVDNQELKIVLAKVYLKLLKGETLADSLKDHNNFFSPQYVAMIWAAEKSGTLTRVLENMASFQEKQDNLRRKLKSAMTYPLMIFLASILVNYFIFAYVLPQFSNIFNNLGIQLPLFTKVLMWLGAVFSNVYFWILLILSFVLVYRLTYDLRRLPQYRRIVDHIKMEFPVFGKIYRNYLYVNIFRLMATMMGAGMNLSEILESLAEVSENAYMEKVFFRIGKALRAGVTITQAFVLEGETFPPLVTSVINVGEESGETDFILFALSDFYENQLDYTLNNMATLVEPILIFLMGLSVMVVVLALFIPLYNMIGSMA